MNNDLQPFCQTFQQVQQQTTRRNQKEAKDIFDKVYSFDEIDDQIDVIGSRGGDICHFRFYNDGTVVEK